MKTLQVPKHLEDRALPIQEAAQYAGVHAQTLRTAARVGEIAFIRRGHLGHYKFRVSALDAWLARFTTAARRVYNG